MSAVRCACGCGGEPKPGRRYIHGHATRNPEGSLVPPNPSGLCACGCGETTPVAEWTSSRRGWVKGEHILYIHNHHSRLSGVAYIINPETGCWEWQRAKNQGGYGRMKVGGRKVQAHRYHYEQKYGPIPDGLFACHKCDNPGCVNPDHIYPGTREENTADMMNRGRHWAQQARAKAVVS